MRPRDRPSLTIRRQSSGKQCNVLGLNAYTCAQLVRRYADASMNDNIYVATLAPTIEQVYAVHVRLTLGAMWIVRSKLVSDIRFNAQETIDTK